MSATVARAFDAIAETYDARFTGSRVGTAQRLAVWRMIDRVFRPGEHILEINCGTGVDAAHLAARGIRVHACDVSAAMLNVARQRLFAVDGVELEQRSTEDLAGLHCEYDGLFSNFGGLNCVEDLPSAVAGFRRIVRVGGSVVLCLMGRFCAWELLWYGSRGQFRKAFRRSTTSRVRSSVGAGESFPICYPTTAGIARALEPQFRLVERIGVGVFVPPSYAESFVADHTRLFKLAEKLDRAVGSWPAFRSMGDHALLHFQKVSE